MNGNMNPAGRAEPPSRPVVSPPNSARGVVHPPLPPSQQQAMPPHAHAPPPAQYHLAAGKPYHPPPHHRNMHPHPTHQPHRPAHPMQHAHHHTHGPPQAMRYGPVPPPHYHRPVHGEFIFQPGPPSHPQHSYRPPAPQRYSYPPAPVHNMPPPHNHQHARTPSHHRPAAVPQSLPKTPAAHPRGVAGTPVATAAEVTPSTVLKKNIVSRGTSPGQHASPPLTAAQPPAQAPVQATPPAEPSAEDSTGTKDVVAPPGPPDGPANDAPGAEGKLAAVDAIFAAAEVIAQRPSPPPSSNLSEGPSSVHPTGVHRGALAGGTAIASPHKPLKKRRFKQLVPSPEHETPQAKAKKAKLSLASTAGSDRAGGKKVGSNVSAPGSARDAAAKLSSLEHERRLSDKALLLARTIEHEPGLYRALLLHMALERETPRKPGGGAPDHSIGKRRGNQYVEGATPAAGERKTVIADGFFWKDVPELEGMLQGYMQEYYEMSENRPQSKKQQEFNNRLVGIIHAAALRHGYTFDPLSFGSPTPVFKPSIGPKLPTQANKEGGDTATPTAVVPPRPPPGFNSKKLRDRIRCYYKTHVQNSKKRLITLLKNPTRPKNREVLIRIVDEVRERAARGVGAGRKIDPAGRAALRRLEATEKSAKEGRLEHGGSSNVTTPGGVAEPRDAPAYSPSANTTPRRVSMGPSHHPDQTVTGDEGTDTEAPFASPCKPEHAAILRSIRQVSVQFD